MPSGSKSPTTETTHGGEAYWGPLSRPKTSACHGPSGGPTQPPLASALSARVVVQLLVAHQCVRWGLLEHHRDMAHLCLHQNGRKQRRTGAGGGGSPWRGRNSPVFGERSRRTVVFGGQRRVGTLLHLEELMRKVSRWLKPKRRKVCTQHGSHWNGKNNGSESFDSRWQRWSSSFNRGHNATPRWGVALGGWAWPEAQRRCGSPVGLLQRMSKSASVANGEKEEEKEDMTPGERIL
jgi:hypothetical protein